MTSNADSIFANRNKFREILLKNLDIQYGKQLVSFQEDSGGVTVLFKNGSSARGDVLVGADGSNSTVRTQLLHGFKADLSPFLMFLGKVILSKAQFEPLLKYSTNGPLAGGPDLKAYVLLMDYLDDGTAVFNWNVSWRSENFEADHAKWQRASQEDQLEKALQLLNNWPPQIVNAFAQSDPADIQSPPLTLMETLLPSQGLPRGRVTLIGDAAHSMVCKTDSVRL
jgi:2-polyprenyl-6-methoxyphenol hydroxylase-like FAD-dependent oxidoreductase